MYNLPKCPKCGSYNIEPKGKTWLCRDCGKLSDIATVQAQPPDPPVKK